MTGSIYFCLNQISDNFMDKYEEDSDVTFPGHVNISNFHSEEEIINDELDGFIHFSKRKS